MSDRSSKPDAPTEAQVKRMQTIWQAVSECFHFIETDDQAKAKGLTHEEHGRRHALFAWAFMVGMEYTATYPNRAIRLIRDKRLGGDTETNLVDPIAEALLELFPKAKVDKDAVLKLRDGYGSREADVLSIKPVFNEQGQLQWEDTDRHPFDWEYELEDWHDSSE